MKRFSLSSLSCCISSTIFDDFFLSSVSKSMKESPERDSGSARFLLDSSSLSSLVSLAMDSANSVDTSCSSWISEEFCFKRLICSGVIRTRCFGSATDA